MLRDGNFNVDVLYKLIDFVLGRGIDFIDFRVECCKSTNLVLNNGVFESCSFGSSFGIAVRVFYKGCWCFNSITNPSREVLSKVVDNLCRNVKLIAEKYSCNRKIKLLSSTKDKVFPILNPDPEDISIDVKMNDLKEFDRYFKGIEFLKNRRIGYSDVKIWKFYLSSDGREIEQVQCYTLLRIFVTGRIGDFNVSVRDFKGTIDGYTIWKKWSFEQIFNTVYKRLENQLKGVKPKGGIFPVVLGPEVVSTFVHEAFGHLAEADLTMSGSVIKDKIGSKIASDVVTIIDDPEVPNGFGTIEYDDEGVKTRKAYLIENGYVKELMVNREYAELLGIEPTGNARAESFKVPPLIRMRNTILKPGDYSFDELIEDIKFGYYLVSFKGGQANLDGTFQVGIQEGYVIKNGRIEEPVKNLSISGNTLEILKEIDAVGKDFEIDWGICGKGQAMFVSGGGPHIRVKKMLIGGEIS